MTKKEWLLQRLVVAECRIKLYVNANNDSLFVNRIKKFIHHPLRVARVILYKKGLIKESNVLVEMFWKKKFTLPLWDENMLVAYYSGSFGLAEIFLVRYLINNIKENDVFYDIGSSFGLYTILAEELSTHIYSFEPNPNTVKYVRLNANLNTKVEAVAISDISGEITFYDTFNSNKSGMSSMFSDIASGTTVGTYKEISVPTITLDDYIVSHEVPTIIKMDVMNADHLVLKGAKELFTKHSPILALRIYNTPLAIERTKISLALLLEYGYSSYSIQKDGQLISVDIKVNKLKFASTFIFKK